MRIPRDAILLDPAAWPEGVVCFGCQTEMGDWDLLVPLPVAAFSQTDRDRIFGIFRETGRPISDDARVVCCSGCQIVVGYGVGDGG